MNVSHTLTVTLIIFTYTLYFLRPFFGGDSQTTTTIRFFTALLHMLDLLLPYNIFFFMSNTAIYNGLVVTITGKHK
jgi:hypothetical protein